MRKILSHVQQRAPPGTPEAPANPQQTRADLFAGTHKGHDIGQPCTSLLHTSPFAKRSVSHPPSSLREPLSRLIVRSLFAEHRPNFRPRQYFLIIEKTPGILLPS